MRRDRLATGQCRPINNRGQLLAPIRDNGEYYGRVIGRRETSTVCVEDELDENILMWCLFSFYI